MCEIFTRTNEPDEKGQIVKTLTLIGTRRGNWRQANGREFLLANAEFNVRQGTLLTHYFKEANEDQHIKINGRDFYEVVSFNHDGNKNTLWTLRLLANGK